MQRGQMQNSFVLKRLGNICGTQVFETEMQEIEKGESEKRAFAPTLFDSKKCNYTQGL